MCDAPIRDKTIVGKIYVWQGAKPGDMPIERPTRIEFVINSSTAKELGLEPARTLVVCTDKVIE